MIISSQDLNKILDNKKNIILDSRWYLKNINLGKEQYKTSHIPNAVFFDIESCSRKNSKIPHAIPSKEEFEKSVSKLGISNNQNIIVYDQTGFVSSTRVWFLFNFFGHKNISILNGGFKNWIKEKRTVTSKIIKTSKSKFKAKIIKNMVIKKKQIQSLLIQENNAHKIVDARPKDRFQGKIDEPRKNVKRGKIPQSINIPFDQIYDDLGNILDVSELKKLFKSKKVVKHKKIICYCGSGITACNLIFALNMLSYTEILLYDGSWAEWGEIKKK